MPKITTMLAFAAVGAVGFLWWRSRQASAATLPVTSSAEYVPPPVTPRTVSPLRTFKNLTALRVVPVPDTPPASAALAFDPSLIIAGGFRGR